MVIHGLVLVRLPKRTSWPIALPSGQYRRASDSSTTATGGLPFVSVSSNARPRSRGVPTAAK